MTFMTKEKKSRFSQHIANVKKKDRYKKSDTSTGHNLQELLGY